MNWYSKIIQFFVFRNPDVSEGNSGNNEQRNVMNQASSFMAHYM